MMDRNESAADWLNTYELPDICQHDWWTCGTASGRMMIIVECRGACDSIGTVEDVTKDEYRRALQFNYRWTDPDRVTVRRVEEF